LFKSQSNLEGRKKKEESVRTKPRKKRPEEETFAFMEMLDTATSIGKLAKPWMGTLTRKAV
jgi:hypothetical protein